VVHWTENLNGYNTVHWTENVYLYSHLSKQNRKSKTCPKAHAFLPLIMWYLFKQRVNINFKLSLSLAQKVLYTLEWFSSNCRKVVAFPLLRYTMGSKNLSKQNRKRRPFLTQRKVKPKSMVTHSHVFSRASRQLQVFTSSFDWFTVLSVILVNGLSDNFGFIVLGKPL